MPETCNSPYVRFGLQTISSATKKNGAPAVGTGVRVGRGVGVFRIIGVSVVSIVGVSSKAVGVSAPDGEAAAVSMLTLNPAVADGGTLATPAFKSLARFATC